MSWLWLKAVPWTTILATAPALVDGARKLLERRGESAQQGAAGAAASDPAALFGRIQALADLQRADGSVATDRSEGTKEVPDLP